MVCGMRTLVHDSCRHDAVAAVTEWSDRRDTVIREESDLHSHKSRAPGPGVALEMCSECDQ